MSADDTITTESPSSSDFVSACSVEYVDKLLKNQESMFREIIHQQQASFVACLEAHMSATNQRVDKLLVDTTRELTEIKASVEFNSRDILELKAKVEAKVSETPVVSHQVTERINTIETNVHKLMDQTDYLDNYSRRLTLRLDGVPEQPNEN